MRTTLLLALAGLVAVAGVSPSAHAQVSPEGRKMMKLASIGVGVGLCGLTMTPETQEKLSSAMDAIGDKQQDFTQEQYKAALQGIANNMRDNKAAICSQMTNATLPGIVDEAVAE